MQIQEEGETNDYDLKDFKVPLNESLKEIKENLTSKEELDNIYKRVFKQV